MQPNIAEPVVTIGQGADVLSAIERFAVAPEGQAAAVEAATARIAAWKQDADFVGAVLLRGLRGGIACYTQWRAVDGVAPEAPTGTRSLAAALPDATLLDSRTYTVAFSDQIAAAHGASLVSLRGTPNAHFGIFSVAAENQDALLDRARENAPKSLSTPDLGLVSINFLRSIDGKQVINLGVWASLGNFGALLSRPGFRDDDQYWTGIADFQPDFFDVVAVETGNAATAKQ